MLREIIQCGLSRDAHHAGQSPLFDPFDSQYVGRPRRAHGDASGYDDLVTGLRQLLLTGQLHRAGNDRRKAAFFFHMNGVDAPGHRQSPGGCHAGCDAHLRNRWTFA